MMDISSTSSAGIRPSLTSLPLKRARTLQDGQQLAQNRLILRLIDIEFLRNLGQRILEVVDHMIGNAVQPRNWRNGLLIVPGFHPFLILLRQLDEQMLSK